MKADHLLNVRRSALEVTTSFATIDENASFDDSNRLAVCEYVLCVRISQNAAVGSS